MNHANEIFEKETNFINGGKWIRFVPGSRDSVMTFSSYPLAQYKAYKKEINQKIEGILNSGNYILGQV